MRVLLSGGTGFIGTALAKALADRGDDVRIITRKRPDGADGARANAVPRRREEDAATQQRKDDGAAAANRLPSVMTWDEWEQDPGSCDGFDAIVNLAGESINQRWTAAAKRRIVDSRVAAADRISSIMRRMTAPPPVVVNASGISLYGHSISDNRVRESSVAAPGAEQPNADSSAYFDEQSPAQPADFLGRTVIEWEAAADRIPAERLVKLRIGLVIARRGGAFPLLQLPYRMFVGGRTGHGKQGLPWIHLQDMIGLILFSLDRPDVHGPLNAVAPDPVTNDQFGRALAQAMRRPHWFPVPGAMLKLALGEMSTLVLTGQLAMPRKALELGYSFAFPRLEEALRYLVR